MKAVVIYESMYGNTHQIANAIAEGPTHVHGMSHAGTRKGAADAAEKPDSYLVLDANADGPGLRDWFESVGHLLTNAAAFDTRFDMPAAITGRASKGIARKLRHRGATLIAEPESFFVKKDNHLEPDEEARAREWGGQLALVLQESTPHEARSS